jgi:2-methylisocitrate lyase-like PEP mutase family enzyme
MGVQAQKLRELLVGGQEHIAGDCYSALTARIMQHTGFKLAYLGGHACSVMHYAIPDIGIFSQADQIDQAGRIAQAIDIPLIVDADTLGETVADAYYYTRRYEQAGVAGIHVEDEVNPKHSTYRNGLNAIGDMQARLEAACKARQDPAFVIIARCDEFYLTSLGGGGGGSMKEAVERGLAYKAAGADALVFPFSTPEQMAEIKAEVGLPMCVLGFPTPGVEIALFSGWAWSGAAQLQLARAKEIMATGTLATIDVSLEGKNALIDQDLYDGLVSDWVRKTGRALRS